ncbi:substrate-binding domain-containing protein [Streptomyces sp. NPDC008313]|uniref:substrate-binding domain-containing protein n=1 Tax=Streptomyces sp. NPDC008313 TaxID=3364826 RepID=UPI0036EA46CA
MREPGDARRQRILAAVESRGSVRVNDLAAELGVSVVTARRDVEELARAGRLRRGHGVARPVTAAEEPAAPPPGPPGPSGGPVALVVPDRHAYLHEAMHGARTALERAGVRVTLHIAPRSPGAERRIVRRALADGARALLVAPRWRTAAEEEADHGWLAATGVPTVLVERRPGRGGPAYALDSVCSDHWYGMHLAVEHLTSLGHRRIVLAARNDSPTARVLRAAFAGIVAARPEIEDSAVVLSSPDAGAGADGREEVRAPASFAALLRAHRATAAVLHGDADALMLVQQLADSGLRVPQDCSVVAYDDVVAGLGSTPLTAVAPPKAEVGRVAAELLLDRLAVPPVHGAGRPRRVELLPELKVRGSTQARMSV